MASIFHIEPTSVSHPTLSPRIQTWSKMQTNSTASDTIIFVRTPKKRWNTNTPWRTRTICILDTANIRALVGSLHQTRWRWFWPRCCCGMRLGIRRERRGQLTWILTSLCLYFLRHHCWWSEWVRLSEYWQPILYFVYNKSNLEFSD